MVKFSSMLIVYFVIGAMMFGAGAITWGDTGVVGEVMGDPGDGGDLGSNKMVDRLNSIGGPIASAAAAAGGALLAVWNFIVEFISFVFWPVTVLSENGAPLSVTVLLGGTISTAFLAGILRTIGGARV